ncbi:sugar ABC transporter ATP-binding protein [Agrobacterium rubi]|uniref:sugar ABC transporter ATP-binding protein n=1 Tax=Agrobacterium rubi TaxID=28099 RepID=UPI001573D46D|nr:sugar ABC transporter ATP-binding protein [Agrobacterium rubi]NTF10183.1 sugar ABC transporter ATP-binding protein [Agrobacterium rubi]NTF21639.1 sugar ABC transporter ATP-binding protein [Agrobacterium rubi]NTF28496.1 sugar ABC transporter ATP-binding protein [Agrobacterium rubi]
MATGQAYLQRDAFASPHDVILELDDITKEFPGVVALAGVQFNLRRGEVHAVCGENGAGKSTLMKVISGVYQPTSGAIRYKGKDVTFGSPRESEAVGIAIIHQELNLVPHLTVAENIYLAREPRRGFLVDRKKLRQDAKRCLDRLGLNIQPDDVVRNLSVAQCQMVEIAKALSLNADVLIMDEPTSSLTEQETAVLFKVIRDLKADGVGIIYISHRLDEMSQIVDRVTILRDGRYVSTDDFAATDINEIVSRMVGRSLEEKFPERTSVPTEEVLLSVSGLSRAGVFSDISFTLKKGEILGFAGLMGAGRTELARSMFGAELPDSGTISFKGRELSIRSPRDAIAEGFAYLSEDRKGNGLAVKMSVAANMVLANMDGVSNRFGIIDRAKHNAVAERYIDLLDIKTPSTQQVVRLLSGGNQQKIIIGKWLFSDAKVFFFDEPTRGIDVGAKYAIYKIMDELAAKGFGVILISSELPEILGMTNRVAVFREGRINAILDTRTTSQEDIIHYASVQKRSSHDG